MPTTTAPPVRYSLTQAAEIAGVCYETVWRAVKSKRLRATRRGPNGRWQVTPEDLNAWAFQPNEGD
jgi:excisionase family DNA binding protein